MLIIYANQLIMANAIIGFVHVGLYIMNKIFQYTFHCIKNCPVKAPPAVSIFNMYAPAEEICPSRNLFIQQPCLLGHTSSPRGEYTSAHHE